MIRIRNNKTKNNFQYKSDKLNPQLSMDLTFNANSTRILLTAYTVFYYLGGGGDFFVGLLTACLYGFYQP